MHRSRVLYMLYLTARVMDAATENDEAMSYVITTQRDILRRVGGSKGYMIHEGPSNRNARASRILKNALKFIDNKK